MIDIIEQIQEVIEKEINPLLLLHAGSISLEKFEDGIAYIILLGGCAGCPSSRFTLLGMIHPFLSEIEGVDQVIPV